MAYAWNNLDRHLAYSHSELGEVLLLNEAAQTVSSKRANNGAVVQAAGTSKATATAHVATIHPGITKIVG